MEQKKRAPTPVRSNLFLLKMIWEISPARVIFNIISVFIDFGMWVFYTVVFTRYLFGSVMIERTFEEVAAFLGFTMVIFCATSAFMSWYNNRFLVRNNQILIQELNKRLFDKAVNVDVSCYESAEFYDSYTRAASEIFDRAQRTLNSAAGVIASVFSSAYVVYVMFTINPLIGAAAILPVAINLIVGRVERKMDYNRRMDNLPNVRRQDYVNRTLYLQTYAKEIRLSSIFGVLMNIYNTATDKIIHTNNRYWKKICFVSGSKNLVIFPIFFEGTWLMSAYLAMVSKTISVADFVVLANAAVSITWMLLDVSSNLVDVFDNALYIDNLKRFLNYEEKISENQDGLPVPAGELVLDVRNVSFRYQGREDYAVRNVSLTLKSGEMVSLVGHNGSGKSTLIKLLMRLYDPTEGEITLNGTDIRKYNLKAYRAIIGTVFQDFQVFSMSVIDNILAGSGTSDRKVAEEAMRKSGIADKIATLPQQGDNILTREFDDNGAILSGGETQKVAIARAFAKDSNIYLLDEPSSALDPIAEHYVYENLVELCRSGKHRMGVLISHRLSSATLADKVYLMQGGNMTESGTHKELMELGGSYKEMYDKQAENYLLGRE